MNKNLKFTLKGVGWIILATLSLIIPLSTVVFSRDAAEYPVGKGLFLSALFHNQHTDFEIDWSPSNVAGYKPIELIVPISYAEAYDSVSGKRRESILYVVRYPGYLAITTQNLLSGEYKYYIVDKSYDLKTTNHHQIKDNYLFATTDSALFIRKCKELTSPNRPSR